MADKKLNELGTIGSFDNAYVELSQNQYRISKTNLGKQLTDEVHLNFSTASDTPAYIFAQKSDGTNFRISKTDLAKAIRNDATALGGEQAGNSTLYEGCYIMYCDTDSVYFYAASYAEWPNLRANSYNKACGVLIIDGGHSLLIAPHEKACKWSSKRGTATDTVSSLGKYRIALFDTWDGMERTKKICTDASSLFYEESNNASTKNSYAPGYCYNYEPFNDFYNNYAFNGNYNYYWLPCVAELMMIFTHKQKINAGLALIEGAQPLSSAFYWSSTESGAGFTWGLNFENGFLMSNAGKTSYSYGHARPVSAFVDFGIPLFN